MEEMRRGGRERAECDRRRLQPFSFPFSAQTSRVKKQKSELFFFHSGVFGCADGCSCWLIPRKIGFAVKKKKKQSDEGWMRGRKVNYFFFLFREDKRFNLNRMKKESGCSRKKKKKNSSKKKKRRKNNHQSSFMAVLPLLIRCRNVCGLWWK